MLVLTHIPRFVYALFCSMPGMWKSRHRLLLCWLILLQSVFPGRKTLKELSRWAPSRITDWRFRRLLKAGYWSIHLLLTWWAQEVLAGFPPPADGTLYLWGDGSEAPKRGKKNPVAQKGRKSKHHPWFFGLRFVLLMAQWDVYRIPVGFRLILPKTHPDYENENTLFRQMVLAFPPPEWATLVIVGGDAAYSSKENMKMVRRKDQADPLRRWGFVFGIARTWKTEEGKHLKDFVNHLPYNRYTRTWIPRLAEGSKSSKKRKTFWIYGKRMRLRHIGDVMMVLSKKGRNYGPKKTKLIVTNLIELTPRQVIIIYQRRWSVELLFWELKSALGLGQHQVTRKEDRIEKSIGIAILAYLFLLRASPHLIQPGKAWSIFQLQQDFRMKIITNEVEHTTELKLKKKYAKAS